MVILPSFDFRSKEEKKMRKLKRRRGKTKKEILEKNKKLYLEQ